MTVSSFIVTITAYRVQRRKKKNSTLIVCTRHRELSKDQKISPVFFFWDESLSFTVSLLKKKTWPNSSGQAELPVQLYTWNCSKERTQIDPYGVAISSFLQPSTYRIQRNTNTPYQSYSSTRCRCIPRILFRAPHILRTRHNSGCLSIQAPLDTHINY